MRLCRWGMAAAVVLVAGCGSSVGGQAVPMPGVTAVSTTQTSTSASIAPFPEPTSAVSTSGDTSTAPTAGSVTTSSTTSATTESTGTAGTQRTSGTASTTTAPSTTVKWQLPLPKGDPAKQNKFGNVLGTPGRSFAIVWTNTKQIAVLFVVDSVQVDRGCAVPVKGKNGHLVVITLRAQLGYSTGVQLSDESIGFTGSDWTAFDAKETAQVGTDTPASDACVTPETQIAFADEMKPDRVYSGKIALDVSSAKGTVVLLNSLDGGWVYSYG